MSVTTSVTAAIPVLVSCSEPIAGPHIETSLPLTASVGLTGGYER